MKTLVFGFLTLFLLVSCRPPLKTVISDKEAILEMMNNERREIAKEKRVSNMHKLVWDESLAEKAKFRDFSGNGKIYRSVRVEGNEQNVAYWKNQYLITDILDSIAQAYQQPTPGLEELIPLQKKIGCAPWFRKVEKEPVTHTLCFLGPEIDGKSWISAKGEPGSKCSDGYKNENGLCALPAQKIAEAGAQVAPTTPGSEKASSTEESGAYGHSTSFSVIILGVVFWFL